MNTSGASPHHFRRLHTMDLLQHRLTQYKGSPGQGSTVKCALNTHHLELKKLIGLVDTLQAQVSKLELALQPEPELEPLVLATPQPAEACAPILVVAALAPVVAAVIPVVLPLAQSALGSAAISSKPTAEASQPPEVLGHYSVSATPASSGNELPTPVAVQASEEGSTDDSVEAILLEAEQHSADRFMSLAKHQQQTTAKVRATAARKRAATPRKSKATP
jgi:hypothetical protein